MTYQYNHLKKMSNKNEQISAELDLKDQKLAELRRSMADRDDMINRLRTENDN